MSKRTFLSFLALLLCLSMAYGQTASSITYDFRDGVIISHGKSDDGALTLSGGSFKLHGATYGLNMKVNGQIRIAVGGSNTIRFLGSKHSGLNLEGKTSTGATLGSLVTKVVTDLVDTYDFVYSGGADTLTFTTIAGTGGDLYLPSIELIPARLGATAIAAEKNIIYSFDFRDGSIVPTITDGKSDIDLGLVSIKVGSKNAYGYNGGQHGSVFKAGNQIILQVSGNAYIKIGGCQYSNGTMSVSSTTGAFNVASQSSKTTQCYDVDGSTVDFLYVGSAGTVVFDFTGTNYVPYVEVAPVPYEISLSSYVQKSGTITLNGKTFTLTSGATASDNATIALPDGIVLDATKTEGFIAMDLGGLDLAALTPTFTGDIANVAIVSSKLEVTYANETSDPKSYVIQLHDNGMFYGVKTYDFRDGAIITNSQSDDGALKLSGGSFKLHGATYGLNMKVGGQIKMAVSGSSLIQFLGSQHSGLKLEGKTSNGTVLGTQNTKVVTDLTDTYDFVYSGGADTLTFTTVAGSGNDLYLPKIDVIAAQMGAAYPLVASHVVYYFDFRDGSIVPTTTDGKSEINKGLVNIKVGSQNGYGYNGNQHGSIFKDGNQVILQVAGNAYIKVGGCQYSNGTINISSSNGRFDKALQPAQTTKCYHEDGTTIDFLYVGEAGTVTLDFVGPNYVPYIEVAPVPFDVELDSWVAKKGTVTLNGVTIGFTAGESSTSNPTVTVDEGTLVSATSERASIRMNLGGKALTEFTPTSTGDIASVAVSGDSLKITFNDVNSKPNSYIITLADNSAVVEAEAGKTYTYNFGDGSVLPQTGYKSLRYSTFTTKDGILTINSNSDNESLQYGYHDSTHGAVLFPGNSMNILVAGNATINFVTCQYGNTNDAIFEFTDANGTVLGSCSARDTTGVDGAVQNFSYSGAKGMITLTLKSGKTSVGEFYLHAMSIENAAIIEASAGKTEVWDFGAEQLDSTLYKNNLTVDVINSWYAETVTVGSSGNVFPSFSAGVLSWVGGSNDRLRTTNTNLSRYDENIASATDYTGRIYVNGSAATGRYLSLTLSEDDEVSIVTRTDAGGNLNFQYVADPVAQTDQVTVSDLTTVNFVAKAAGTYHIFDNKGKPSYFRIYRKDATYVNLTGAVNTIEAAGIPAGYTIQFKNDAGKTWKSTMSNSGYSVKLPVGYNYSLSLIGANGFIITSNTAFEVTESAKQLDVTIKLVELYTVTGAVTGLGDAISKVKLVYTPDASENVIFKPEPVVNVETGSYSVQLEPNVQYTISASGVNDFWIPQSTITIGKENETSDVVFEAKTVYQVGIQASGLTAEQLAKLSLTFTNRDEAGCVYAFTSVDEIQLRNGTYSIAYTGLDEYPVQLGLTSNLKVDGAATSKTLAFKAVTNWSFDDKVIANGTASYKGLLFTGTVSSELAKGHITAKPDATINVPVNAGEKIKVTYYYTADFSFDGGTAITTASNSTGTLESVDYTYSGASAGFVTITIGSGAATTYITDITSSVIVPFSETIEVGANKTYKSVTEALIAISKMVRTNNERVTVMIDPGNYEEMLVIDIPNVTLKNAATTPSIALLNQGVDIDANAVRITSYYGHGYNYYSMGNNQKWNADILRVNQENGYLSYENKGSGTTNGSYWNATVVVSANGFEAENIIFENSFNQYISKKESEDVVVMWESGNKGLRPTDAGNSSVQKRSFVERAAAIAITNNTDQVVLNRCRVVGRQDSFFGGTNCRVVVYKGAMMGAVDYMFGGMIAVFYKTDLVMNVSDDKDDASYLTAAQQGSGRGYLMYECFVKSAESGVETASLLRAKPGYFGRPWQATTSEVVFYKTTIDTTNYTGSEGKSLILPAGWMNTLSGESKSMCEYGTVEMSGADNSSNRTFWSTVLTAPTLSDGTEITTFNFTKGTDDWDPIPTLVSSDKNTDVTYFPAETSVKVSGYGSQLVVSHVKSAAKVQVYGLNGVLYQAFVTDSDTRVEVGKGFWIVRVSAADGQKAFKVVTR